MMGRVVGFVDLLTEPFLCIFISILDLQLQKVPLQYNQSNERIESILMEQSWCQEKGK
jgi:hypothetical protein